MHIYLVKMLRYFCENYFYIFFFDKVYLTQNVKSSDLLFYGWRDVILAKFVLKLKLL